VKRTALLLILFCILYAAGAAGSDLQQVYRSIQHTSRELVPEAYSVEVENEQFSRTLSDLPPEILTGDPSVMVRFNKGEGVRMYIENVQSEYANLFDMYERYLQLSGITRVQNPEEFGELMDKGLLALQEENARTVVIQAWDPESEERGDDYALFTLGKDKWMIRKAMYYLDGRPFMELETTYDTYGEYVLPSRITLTSLPDNEKEVFRFRNYRFNG
jgi:hypothetical protein